MRYRVAPPAPGERIRWPDGFGRRFAIFCDVEEEFDWARPLDRRNTAVTAVAALPAAHARFVAAGAGLTCMVDWPVVANPAARDHLAEVAAHPASAIGAQLHPWVTPPFDERVTPANSYAGNLPPALEAAKLDRLTAALADAFGTRPLAYRAGRYGIGPATLKLLADRGYRIDASVRAGYDYRGDGGPCFDAVGNAAYRRGGLIELPFSTVHTGLLRRRGAALHPLARRLGRLPGALARTRLLNRVPLTPEGVPVGEALAAIDAAAADGERLLCFSFHSPSLVPGNTPYVRDAADLRRFEHWWGAVLERLARAGICHASQAQILAAADMAAR